MYQKQLADNYKTSMETKNFCNLPEVLAPAGDMEKLKTAIRFGANAVYFGGNKFGLREAAGNFTKVEISEAVQFCHSFKAKAYVVLNSFVVESDVQELIQFIKFLDSVKVDAVIVSDIGVLDLVKQHSDIEIHISTQANCINSEGAKFWKSQGAKRVILGREVSLSEAKKIKQEAEIEVEMFIHGSLCMAYSGNCTISNFTQGRDSNRGGCAHSCRFEYELDYSVSTSINNEKKDSFFMSSKDLNGIEHIRKYLESGIDSIKIEGRMKSLLYVATTSKAYSEVLKACKDNNTSEINKTISYFNKELEKIPHRDYTDFNLIDTNQNTVFDKEEKHIDGYFIGGNVLDQQWISQEVLNIYFEVKNNFTSKDNVEILSFNHKNIELKNFAIQDIEGNEIEQTKPNTISVISVKMNSPVNIEKDNIIRIKRNVSL